MGALYFNGYIGMDADTLKAAIRKQVEYYFSEENLIKDCYLRRKMDDEGFIPVTLIASFHRVRALSSDVSVIIDAIKESEKLELVSGFKIRTKTDPTKWPIKDADVSLNGTVPPPILNASLAAEPLSGIPPPPTPRNFRIFPPTSELNTEPIPSAHEAGSEVFETKKRMKKRK